MWDSSKIKDSTTFQRCGVYWGRDVTIFLGAKGSPGSPSWEPLIFNHSGWVSLLSGSGTKLESKIFPKIWSYSRHTQALRVPPREPKQSFTSLSLPVLIHLSRSTLSGSVHSASVCPPGSAQPGPGPGPVISLSLSSLPLELWWRRRGLWRHSGVWLIFPLNQRPGLRLTVALHLRASHNTLASHSRNGGALSSYIKNVVHRH